MFDLGEDYLCISPFQIKFWAAELVGFTFAYDLLIGDQDSIIVLFD